MRAPSLRVPGLVALATGAGIAAVLPVGWAASRELPDRLAVTLVIAAYALTALVILLARPGNRVARIMLLGTCVWALGELLLSWGVQGWAGTHPSVLGSAHAAVLGTALRGAGWLVLILGVPLAFPDGVTAWPRRREPHLLMGGAILLLVLGCVLAPYPLESTVSQLRSPTGVPLSAKWVADLLAISALILAFVTLVIAVVGLRTKWRRAEALARQQLLWFSAAFALPLICLPLAASPWGSPWLFAAASAPTPVALGVALLQRRLYDIELVLSRSLTYVLVSCAAVLLYAMTIGAVGILLRRPGAEWLPWVGAAVVAVAFSPLKLGVQAVANRVTYGHWASPADVLAATESRLRDATDLPGLIAAMVTELAELLRLPSLEVVDATGRVIVSAGNRVAAQSSPEHPAGPRREASEVLPLTAYGESVGTMRWTRTPLRPPDRRLLEGVGRQLGEALHSQGLMDQLRAAQERLVLAREEERKRLRRDLHDGLGPSLAALGLEVDSLRNRVLALTADQTDTELIGFRSGIQHAIAEVRRVVEGLRPPALDELGLSGAVEQLVHRLTGGPPENPPEVTLEIGPLPALPAATDVAAYRIIQEALTNVMHHAQAQHVHVGITAEGPHLILVVRDDGHVGFTPREGGIGLSAMRERADELSGSLVISTNASVGTTVTGHLPLPLPPLTPPPLPLPLPTIGPVTATPLPCPLPDEVLDEVRARR